MQLKRKIVLEGNKTIGDKLWDIPVQKINISPILLNSIPRHASIYVHSSLRTPLIKIKRPRIKKLPTRYNNIFVSMDTLIQVHECNNILNKQLQHVRKSLYNHEFANLNAIIDDNIKVEYAMLNTNENRKLNVIIRKKEPKVNSATFYMEHVGLQSRVHFLKP